MRPIWLSTCHTHSSTDCTHTHTHTHTHTQTQSIKSRSLVPFRLSLAAWPYVFPDIILLCKVRLHATSGVKNNTTAAPHRYVIPMALKKHAGLSFLIPRRRAWESQRHLAHFSMSERASKKKKKKSCRCCWELPSSSTKFVGKTTWHDYGIVSTSTIKFALAWHYYERWPS
jgi:hypothetical protein